MAPEPSEEARVRGMRLMYGNVLPAPDWPLSLDDMPPPEEVFGDEVDKGAA